MPTYEYTCKNCQYRFEEMQNITAKPLTTCPQCQQEQLQRGPGGGIGLSFQGSGFYITDYVEKPKPKKLD